MVKMNKTACIMCAKEKPGLPVREDAMLGAMRWIKRNITRNPKNYRLVVCKEDFLTYRKKREGYERKQIIYVLIGLIFLVALGVSTKGNLNAIAFGLVIVLLMFGLAQLSYIPSVAIPATARPARKKSGK